MSWIQRMFRRRLQDDSAAEWREHVEQKTNHLIHTREVWQWPHFESLWADAKLAVRQLGRSPGIALVAVITLALGIGANTAIFTLTWNIVLRGLPVPHPEQ